jgi:hypothetical protein
MLVCFTDTKSTTASLAYCWFHSLWLNENSIGRLNWQTERLWFKMRLGDFAPVSKQLTLKPDEMRTDPQLTPSSNKTNALGAGQERSSARGRTKFQSGLKPELAR